MSKRWTTAALVVVALSGGCKRDVEPVSWEALDLEALQAEIAAPTGTVDEASVSEVARDFVRNRRALDAVLGLIEDVFSMSDQGGGPYAWFMPRLEGTNVFVEVACPGPVLADPVLDFSEGSLRLDSPSLSQEYAETFFIEGGFLLSLDACRVGPFLYLGASPGHYVIEDRTLAIDFEWDWENLDDDTTGRVANDILWNIGDRFSLLYTLDDGDTLVVESGLGEPDFEVRGSNGSFVCTVGPDPLDPTCMPP